MNQILRDQNNKNNPNNGQNSFEQQNNFGYNNMNNNFNGYPNYNNYYNYKPYQPVITKTRNNDYYKQGRSKASIKTIARVFSIFLILFSIVIIGQSTLALSSNKNKPKDIPQVNVEKMGKEVTISIQTEKPTKGIEYWWNDEEKTKLGGSETNKVSHTIEVPNGNNILNIMVEDHYGNKTYYNKQYIFASTDTTKPVIEIGIIGTKLRIKASDETKLSYIEYKWNDEEPTRINATQGQNEIEQEIDVKQGKNDLNVIAVDGEGNKESRTEKIIGDNNPEVSILTEGSYIVVNAKDDEGITKITVTIDGEEKDSGEDTANQKEVSAKVQVPVGTHEIKATVTNVNGLEATKEITASI